MAKEVLKATEKEFKTVSVDGFGNVREKYVVKTDEMDDNVGRYEEEKTEDKPGEP